MVRATQTEEGGRTLVHLEGSLDRHTVPELHKGLMRTVRGGRDVVIHLGDVQRVDSAGAVFIAQLVRAGKSAGRRVRVADMSPNVRRTLGLFRLPGEVVEEAKGGGGDGLLTRLGSWGLDYWRGFMGFVMMTADCFVWTFGGAPRTRRVRKGAIWMEGNRLGVDSIAIVGLIAFLIGIVVALQSAYQLRQFGADIFVANLIAVSMTREMGPLMTAIIMAGRSGAAIAAEAATMSVNEELTSLEIMGLEPVRYVVVPKFQAISMVMPALTVLANLLGIFGGFLVAFLYMKLGAATFFGQVIESLVLKDLITGLVKSLVFAWLIVLIASYNGFQAYGGAESVGRVTTQSVVSSIFWVIVADALFNIVFYFGD